MKQQLTIALILPLLAFGQKKKSVSGVYMGWWGDTQWIYHFDNNNTFLFDISGHFDVSKTLGSYYISGDTLFLKSFPKEFQPDSNFNNINKQLLLDGDSCIVDLQLHYDYCKPKSEEIYMSRTRTIAPEANKPKLY